MGQRLLGPPQQHGIPAGAAGSRDVALELVAEKKEFDANREIKVFEGTDIKILRGRYGPYITDGNKNARIPKDVEDPATLDLATCEELIAKAPFPKSKRKKAAAKKKAAPAKKKATRKKAAKNKAAKQKTVQAKATADAN